MLFDHDHVPLRNMSLAKGHWSQPRCLRRKPCEDLEMTDPGNSGRLGVLVPGEEINMYSKTRIAVLVATFITGIAGVAEAQTPTPSPAPAATPPLFATTKVDGTDNVYIFRYQNHQAMFVVTPAGVIVTDPIGYGRPQAVKVYLDEIRKITQAPIKYLIYSHHHYDHIAGGKPFKDAGAVVVAHSRAKERLAALKACQRRHARSGRGSASARSSSEAPRLSSSTPGVTIPIHRS